MTYQVRFSRSARRELSRLSSTERARIGEKAYSLGDHPRQRGAKKLTGREEYSLRVGDYRILYIIDDRDSVVAIRAVWHRREAYR